MNLFVFSRFCRLCFVILFFCAFVAGRAALACGGCAVGACGGACRCGCATIASGGNSGGGGGSGSGSDGPFNSSNMVLQSHLQFSEIGGVEGTRGSGITGWVDSSTGHEYAVFGLSNGASFVDVTIPTAPVYMGILPTQTGVTPWRELQVYQNTLYVASDLNGPHGIQTFDLTQLRGVTTPTTFAANGRITQFYEPDANVTYDVTTVHTLEVNKQTGFLYANGTNVFGFQLVWDLKTDPINPTFVGYRAAEGYVHDSLPFVYGGPDTSYVGHELTLNFNGQNGFSLIDMTQKANPLQISQTIYPGVGYTHQGAVTEDGRFLLIDDEFDESQQQAPTRTIIYDLADLANPRYLGAYTHDTVAIDHNMYIKGNYVYQSNYTTGLRVFSLENLPLVSSGVLSADNALTPVGFFDTYPENDNPGFEGTWGNYPYLPSGNILVGDINNGLFVVSMAGPAAVGPEPGSLALMLVPMVGSGVAGLRLRRCKNAR